MVDSVLNQFVARGTNAERLAFTPDPGTPAVGPDPGYFFYETDTGDTYAWDGSAWDPVGGGDTTALSTSLSQVSSSLSSEISSRVSGDTSLSTVISGSISVVNSSVASLSTAVGGGGGSGWTLVDQNGAPTASPTWTYSAPVANVDVINLSAYNELLIFALGVATASGLGTRAVVASVDNGSTFYTASGDYIDVSLTGIASNTTFFINHGTGAAAARTLIGHIRNLKGAVKMVSFMAGTSRYFVASASDIDAIRLFDGTVGANLSAGTLYVYVR